MSERFPEFLDPYTLCRRAGAVHGEVPVARMERLTSLGVSPRGDVQGRLEFGRDDRGRAVVDVAVKAVLGLTCQRCLQDLALDVAERRRLVVVESAALAERLEDDLEPLVVTDGRLRPADVLEDELLLALPIIPAHPEGRCQPPGGADEPPGAGDAGKRSPFAGLAVLKGGPPGPGRS